MQTNTQQWHKFLLLALLLGLILLSFEILKYFIIPVLWATIIAYMTWPIYQRIFVRCGQRANLAASLMTILVLLVIGIPLILGIFTLQHEGRSVYLEIQRQLYAGEINLPQFIQKLPVIGGKIQQALHEFNLNPKEASQNMGLWIQGHLGYGKFVLTEISKNFAKFCMAFFSLFFFYRDGQNILAQVRNALVMVIGERTHRYMDTISDTTRAVVYGIGLTALGQALLAGLSYWVAGVNSPVLLTLVTFVLALIPFGTPVAYSGVALWLLSQGNTIGAVGVMLWGVMVVSTSDNFIRPLVISGATKIPFLLIMFGVLGGISSFGLVGLFVGPVVLAILLACWREWLQENRIPSEGYMP